MPDRYCPNCGNGVRKSDRYCLKCGTEVPSLDSEDDGNLHDAKDGTSSGGSRDRGGRSEDNDGVDEELERGSPQQPQSGDSLETSPADLNDEGSDDEASTETQYSVEDVPPGKPPPDSLRPRTDEHGWPGKLWVGLGWFGLWVGGGFSIIGILSIILTGNTLSSEVSFTGTVIGFVSLLGIMYLFYRVIRAVRDFHKTGWVVLAILLPLSFTGSLATLLSSAEPSVVAQSVVQLPLSVLWMWYFWTNRESYGISIG